jgi:glycosyltransferase involved in cell wall biosynthesis
MNSLQLLRTGFPDRSFFGNIFVAANLARDIPDSRLIAALSKNYSPAVWSRIAKENLDIDLGYANYVKQPESLCEIVEKNESEVVNFHFAETDLNPNILNVIPESYGDSVLQIMHLHCSAEFFLSKNRQTIRRINDIHQALDNGLLKKFVAVSYQVRDSFEPYIPKDMISVVQNGIRDDIYQFREERDKDEFKSKFSMPGLFTIGYAGRLDTIKGYDDLVRIVKWFNDRPEFDVNFMVASSGGKRMKNLESDLKQHAPRILADNRFSLVLDVAKYTGGKKIHNRKVYGSLSQYGIARLGESNLYKGIISVPLQASCDVYVQPSHFEAIGLSVIEAAFVGVPIVGYRVGGIPEVVNNTNGSIIDFHNKISRRVDDACEAITYELDRNYGSGEKDTVAFRKEHRDRLVDVFGSKIMAKKTLEVYRSL